VRMEAFFSALISMLARLAAFSSSDCHRHTALSVNRTTYSAGRRRGRSAAVILFGSSLAMLSPVLNALPSAKIGRAALIFPTAAESAYPIASDSVHTSTLGTPAPVPHEIVELSRALGGNVDAIYDFVRNYVDTVFMFGAQKGALGAIVDKSGTPFDQAELMVALLRQAGYTASYQLGTITLSSSQFQQWTNISNSQAACDLLASGGIPGSVNGSAASLLCSSISSTAPFTGVTMEHVWVDVIIGGTHYVFDPSYKPYNFTAAVNLASAAGLNSGDSMTAATGTGFSTGTVSSPAVNYVKNLSAETLTTQLTTYAANLQGYIQSQNSVAGVPLVSGKIIDLVGGREISRFTAPSGGLRQTSLPYASSLTRTWAGDVPDQFRASFAVTLTKANSAGTFDTTVNNQILFPDDIYGRKLIYNTNFINKGTLPFTGSLNVVDEFGTVLASFSPFSSPDNPGYSVGTLTITLNHPYVADANGTATGTPGTYMDTTISRSVRYTTPFTIVHGWGEANRGLVDKWASRPNSLLPPNIPVNGCGEQCGSGHRANKGDALREQLAALWLVQSSKAARLHASIANSIYTHHHTIGIVAGDTETTTVSNGANPPVYEFSVAENFDRIDADTGFSVISTTSNAGDRRVAIQAIAATMECLEGSVSAQQSDLPDTVSTATRFEWGNRPPPPADDPSGPSGLGIGPRRFFDLTSANVANIQSLLLVEGNTSTTDMGIHGGASPTIGSSETASRQYAVASILTPYTSAGFRVIASEEAFLGPGQRAGSFIKQGATTYVHRYSKQRGGAFVATLYDTNGIDPLEIAHVAVNVNQDASVVYGIKGGGGGTQPDQQSNYDPSTAADILKGQFVDRSEVLGVDLQTGGLTYTSPASLTVGNGEFPYSLSASLIWRGGIQQDQTFSSVSHVAPNTPWTTNWNNTLTISGSALEAMGEGDIRAAAGTVAAFLAIQDVYRSPVTPQREVTAVLVGSWWAHQITGNVATVSVGTETRQFLRKFDNSWFFAGPKGYATLAQTGQRAIYTEPNCSGVSPTYVLTRGWDYSSVGFVVTNANGDRQNFQFWANEYTNGGAYCADLHGFRLSSWTFPYGMTINLVYQPNSNSLDELVEVNNSLGRKIHFTTSGFAGFDNELTGADARSVTAVDTSPTTSTHTDPAGAVTTINHSLAGYRYLLTNVLRADNGTTPALAYTYDTLNRVELAQDAVALRNPGTRNPYQFFIGEGARGERQDPAGGQYTVYYDIYRRPFGYADELNRSTGVTHDGRGRVTSNTYPEGNQQIFTYDDHNNTASLLRVAKPGSPLTFAAIQAVWDQTWNKPSSITDALGCLTTFNYYPSGAGTSLLQNATRCKPDSTQMNPVYAFTYNSLGQKLMSTDPTSLVVSNSYDTAANGGNLLSSALDPTGVNAITSYGYDAVGNTTSVTDPRLNVTENQYDLDRRKTVTLHHNGGVTTCLIAAEKTIYDILGRPTEQDGATTFSTTSCTNTVATWQMIKSTTYTDNGKVFTEKDGAGDTTTYGYDPMDRAILVTDPVNRRVGTVYDLAGQALCTWRGWDSTTAPSTCSGWVPSSYNGTGKFLYGVYAYSPNGKQTSITDANNNLTGMTYDGVDRLITLSFPLPTSGSLAASTIDYESYTYDANDNRKSVRKRDGQVINYNFDSLNRQVTKILPGTTTADVWSTYDLAGRPMTDYFGSAITPTTSGIVYAYDTAKRMTSETQFGRAMSYQYDKVSNRIQTTWPDANFINYDFDALNREYQVRENGATSGSGVLAVYQYDSLSRRQSLTHGNGTVTNLGYDTASRLASLGHDVAGTAQDVGITFGYTLASQLQTRSSNNNLYDWLPAASSSTFVTNGLNQYATVAGATYVYDARGNLTSDGTNAYTYDVENRLLTASGPTAVTLGYDPLGRLQSTTVSATATQYLYSGTELVAELDGSGNVLRRYVHGSGTDDPIVWYEGATLTTRNHLHADERGSIIATTDASGAATIYTYGPYGEPNNNNWTGSRFRYTGQSAIPEAHLYYYKARIYSPTLGRFLQTDPIGTKDDLNLYTYVGNDPLDKTDSAGTCDDGKPVCVQTPALSAASAKLNQVVTSASTKVSEIAAVAKDNVGVSVTLKGTASVNNVGVQGSVTADKTSLSEGNITVSARTAGGGTGLSAQATANLDIGPKDIGDVKLTGSARLGLAGAQVNVGEKGVNGQLSLGPQLGSAWKVPAPTISRGIGGSASVNIDKIFNAISSTDFSAVSRPIQ
jgi:RHS repeat-associated protein